jgi:heat shock protein HslJ
MGAAASGPSRSVRRILVVWAVGSLMAGVSACGGDGSPPETSPASSAASVVSVSSTATPPTEVSDRAGELANIEWQLVAYTLAGGTQRTPGVDQLWVFRVDGHGGFSTNGCNDGSGDMTVTGGRLDGTYREGTDVGCLGEAADLDVLVAALADGPSQWTRQADELRIDTGTASRVFQPRTPPWPDQSMHTVLEELSVDGGPQFHVGWRRAGDGYSMSYEGRENAGLPWGSAGSTLTGTGGAGALALPPALSLNGRLIVFGLVAPSAERVAYVVDDGPAVDFDITAIDDYVRVFAGVVAPIAAGQSVQWDADGNELSRSLDLPR